MERAEILVVSFFPNLRIQWNPDSGTYHGSEVNALFSTFPAKGIQAIPDPTGEEYRLGDYMRGAWAAFAKDPEKGWMGLDGRDGILRNRLIRLWYGNCTGPNEALPSLYEFCD